MTKFLIWHKFYSFDFANFIFTTLKLQNTFEVIMDVSVIFVDSQNGSFVYEMETYIPQKWLRFVDEKIAYLPLNKLRKVVGYVPKNTNYFVEV